MQNCIGPLMVGIRGLILLPEEQELLAHPNVGAVILFTRNYQSKLQLKTLCQQIKRIRDPQLLIAVDQEGGRVQRFRNGFTSLPSFREIGKVYQQSADDGFALAKSTASTMARELLDIGVDFSFTPVLDCDAKISEVIADRSFHAEPEVVSNLASCYIKAMHEVGMPAIGKHFPGHGALAADSHISLPIDKRDFDDIVNFDLVPFEKLIRAGLDGIMPAHIIYQKLDKKPAGFSSFWLNEILRQRLNFAGVIFSDDLGMNAAKAFGDALTRVNLALKAGCDMALLCNDFNDIVYVVENLKHDVSAANQKRLLEFCKL